MLADSAKVGILAGSLLSGLLGFLFLRAIPASPYADGEPPEGGSPSRTAG
jgi:hypothetical protein